MKLSNLLNKSTVSRKEFKYFFLLINASPGLDLFRVAVSMILFLVGFPNESVCVGIDRDLMMLESKECFDPLHDRLQAEM